MKKIQKYTIIKKETYLLEIDNAERSIVLAMNEKENQFVTWEAIKESNGTEYNWGHYYTNRERALRDYHERLANAYKMPWED